MQCVCWVCSCVELRGRLEHTRRPRSLRKAIDLERGKVFANHSPFSIFACVLWTIYNEALCFYVCTYFGWLIKHPFCVVCGIEWNINLHITITTLYLRFALVFSFCKIYYSKYGWVLYIHFYYIKLSEKTEKMRIVRKALWSTSDTFYSMASFLTSLFLLPFELFLDHISTTT